MIIGLLKETETEKRVSILPDVVANLIKLKTEVWFEADAGLRALQHNDEYLTAGAVLKSRNEILSSAEIILCIHPLSSADLVTVKSNSVVVGVYQPLFNFITMTHWAEKGMTTFSLDMLPRTTRAQAMDVLSSQANIAGYKAVLVAASAFPKYFPMLMTAAGSISPAKVLVIGAGVAGLQAIATAKG